VKIVKADSKGRVTLGAKYAGLHFKVETSEDYELVALTVIAEDRARLAE